MQARERVGEEPDRGDVVGQLVGRMERHDPVGEPVGDDDSGQKRQGEEQRGQPVPAPTADESFVSIRAEGG